MDTTELHRCSGCQYDSDSYQPECEGCRRKSNLAFNKPDEPVELRVLEDRHTGVVAAVTYGSTKILKRRNSM